MRRRAAAISRAAPGSGCRCRPPATRSAARRDAERDARPDRGGVRARAPLRRRREPRAADPARDARTELELALRRPRTREELEAAALGGRGDRAARRGSPRTCSLSPARPGRAADPARARRAPTSSCGERRRALRRPRGRRGRRIARRRRADDAVSMPTALRLEQALGNLVDNALATGAAGPLRARAAADASSCMSPTRARGSRRASRRAPSSASAAPTRRAAGGGTGLGLAIVEAIARRTRRERRRQTATAAAPTSGSRCRRRRRQSGEEGSGNSRWAAAAPGSAAPVVGPIGDPPRLKRLPGGTGSPPAAFAESAQEVYDRRPRVLPLAPSRRRRGAQGADGAPLIATTQVYLRKLDRQRAMERVRDLSWGVATTDESDGPVLPQSAEERFASSPAVGAGGFEPP